MGYNIPMCSKLFHKNQIQFEGKETYLGKNIF